MTHDVTKHLSAGEQFNTVGTPIVKGDVIGITHTERGTTMAVVKLCSRNILEIECNGARSRLAPLNPAETANISIRLDRKAVIAWVVQPTANSGVATD
jgi:hypothetical protein